MAEVAKKRISSLAKRYEIPSDTLVAFLRDSGFAVKSAMSMIDQQTFMAVKHHVLAEKERLERDELVKSGKKIPMKAVLKKAPKVTKMINKVESPADGPMVAVPGFDSKTGEKVVVPVIKPVNTQKEVDHATEEARSKVESLFRAASNSKKQAAERARPVEKTAEAPVSDGESKQTPEPKSATEGSGEKPVEAEAKSPAMEEKPEKKKDEPKSDLKVSVEKPNAEVLARVNKAREDRQRSMRQGYSGTFGRVPGAPPAAPAGGGPRDRRRPSSGETIGSREAHRDVFAQRALDAGVTAGSLRGGGPPAKPDRQRAGGPPPKAKAKGRGRRKSREQIEQELVSVKNSVSKVMASLSRQAKPKFKGKKEDEAETNEQGKRSLEVGEYITIGELAGLMNANPNQVIAKCMEMGLMVTINQRLDHETIALIADEFGFEALLMEEYQEEQELTLGEDSAEDLQHRAPIITVMGHVDHGKTSILDYIRHTNVIAGESGGITQHIGAYMVETDHGPICFLDTPGHAAFSAMRARGAEATDVVLLVVAADSMVMPQTKESIALAKNSNVQIVVAINKIDLETSNPDKIRAQLAEAGVLVEQMGGNVQCVEVSAKSGLGMDKLLQTLALETELQELKANPNRNSSGVILESRVDKGKGVVATVLIQNGTLRVGDAFVTGIYSGKVRSILDERGKTKEEAGPSTPVQILGLDGAPQAGDSFTVVENEREARDIASRRRLAAKDRELRQKRHITLDQLYDQIKQGEFHELNVIIKADVDGSVEAIAASLERLTTPEVKVNVINKAVGTVTENDVHLAATANALIIGFHVLPSEAIRNLAEEEGVSINNYRVIYDIVDEVRSAMEGMLSPEVKEEVAGEAEIKQVFQIPKIGVIAGCMVQSGTVERDAKVRLYRDGIEVCETKVMSLRRHKEDVQAVRSGYECGIGLSQIKDIREGDVLAFFKKVEVARKLTAATHA